MGPDHQQVVDKPGSARQQDDGPGRGVVELLSRFQGLWGFIGLYEVI